MNRVRRARHEFASTSVLSGEKVEESLRHQESPAGQVDLFYIIDETGAERQDSWRLQWVFEGGDDGSKTFSTYEDAEAAFEQKERQLTVQNLSVEVPEPTVKNAQYQRMVSYLDRMGYDTLEFQGTRLMTSTPVWDFVEFSDRELQNYAALAECTHRESTAGINKQTLLDDCAALEREADSRGVPVVRVAADTQSLAQAEGVRGSVFLTYDGAQYYISGLYHDAFGVKTPFSEVVGSYAEATGLYTKIAGDIGAPSGVIAPEPDGDSAGATPWASDTTPAHPTLAPFSDFSS